MIPWLPFSQAPPTYVQSLEIHEGKTKQTNAEEVPATIKLFFFFSLNNVGKVMRAIAFNFDCQPLVTKSNCNARVRKRVNKLRILYLLEFFVSLRQPTHF